MNKSKMLRNIIAGVASAVLIACIMIPVFIVQPWSAAGVQSGDDPPTGQITYPNESITQPPWDFTTDEVPPVELPPDNQQEPVDPVDPPPGPVITNPPPVGNPPPNPPVIPVASTPAPTTTRPPATTRPPVTTRPTTTRAPTTTSNPRDRNPTDNAVPGPYQGEDDPRAVLSYKMNATDGYFYNEQDAWQRNFGFMNAYDQASGIIMMFYDTVRLKFNYGGWDWRIQLWKGQYGFMFIGGEVGVYYRTANANGRPPSSNAFYHCVPDEHMLNMSTALFFNGEFMAKRPFKPYWWCTTFVPGTLRRSSDRSQVRYEIVIEMKDSVMADAFEQAVIKNGFSLSGRTYAQCLRDGFDHSDVYARSGSRFAINWLLAGVPPRRANTSAAY